MPNLYAFYKENTAPSGWERVTTYDGKYARCGNAVAQHGTTAGNSSHVHALSTYTIGNSTSVSWVTGSDSGYMSVHAGHTLSLSSCSSENNDPPYYTLTLIRIDASTFESSVKVFPPGVVVASTAAISHADFTRDTDLDNRFVKLGDYGSTGGRATSNGHSCSFNLSSYTPSSFTGNSYSLSSRGSNRAAHTHTFSGTTDTRTTLPKKVTTRIYTTNKTTTSIPVNIVCFFDGTPSSMWTAITDWNDCCIYGGDSNPAVDGSDTHSHGDLSGTSSSYTDGAYDYGGTG